MHFIRWIAIYLLARVIRFLNNWGQEWMCLILEFSTSVNQYGSLCIFFFFLKKNGSNEAFANNTDCFLNKIVNSSFHSKKFINEHKL